LALKKDKQDQSLQQGAPLAPKQQQLRKNVAVPNIFFCSPLLTWGR